MENLGYVCPLIFYLFIYFQTEEHRGWGGRFSITNCFVLAWSLTVKWGMASVHCLHIFFSFFSLIHDNLWLIICRLDWLRGQCHASGGWINGMWWVEAQNGNEHKSLKYDALHPPPSTLHSTSFHLDGHGPQPTLPLIWIAAFTPSISAFLGPPNISQAPHASHHCISLKSIPSIYQIIL